MNPPQAEAAIAAEMARSAGQAIAAESATAADQSDADALQKKSNVKNILASCEAKSLAYL